MKTIGVTGGIGAGKSVVCKVLACMGIPVYNSDAKAKEIVHTNLTVKKAIQDLLGEEAYVNGNYNTKYVSAKIFTDAVLMQKLNAIIHPAVQQDFENWKAKQTKTLVAKETALLFQTELWKTVDYSILVFADQNTRIKRIQERDPQRSLAEINAIFEKQGDQTILVQKADFVVYNHRNESIIAQIRDILNKIES